MVVPRFVWQQTKALLANKLNTLISEAAQLQKPYKHQKIFDELPYFEQLRSARLSNRPRRKDGDKEKHA